MADHRYDETQDAAGACVGQESVQRSTLRDSYSGQAAINHQAEAEKRWHHEQLEHKQESRRERRQQALAYALHSFIGMGVTAPDAASIVARAAEFDRFIENGAA